MKRVLVLFSVFLVIMSCSRSGAEVTSDSVDIESAKSEKLIHIPSSPQREGDPDEGRKYLLEGDYLDSGIPLAVVDDLPFAPKTENYLNRGGRNATLPPELTATKAANGVDIIAPNCLTCHGGYLNEQYILGLGNHAFDGTMNSSFAMNALGFMVKNKFPEDTKEWEAFEQFYKSTLALSGNTSTETMGTNSADKITEVLLAHRQLPDFKWSNEPLLDINKETIPADPPAWWLLKKKNAEFTTGIGRGDHARISTASGLLTMNSTKKVEEIDKRFVDVMAYIRTIEAPEFPGEIDQEAAALGSLLFNEKCSKCHGSYGEVETYPNYLVHLDLIKTDPTLSDSYHERKEFVDMYNESWFGQGDHSAKIVPGHGYVAPPLDGVWATAPYLHNGSVPTIKELLDSPSRPQYWKRSFSNKDYDWENLGWNYEEKESKLDNYTYDTTLQGYGNEGHYFGDMLNEVERDAVLEYLKTL